MAFAAIYQELEHSADQDRILSRVVGLIIPRAHRILLLKRHPLDYMPNVWEIPGGHVDPGESIGDALARELQEETGFSLREVRRYVGRYDYSGEFGRTRQWNFEVSVHTADRIVHPEHVAYAWITKEEVAQYPMTEEMRTAVLQYFIPMPDPISIIRNVDQQNRSDQSVR